MFNITYYFSNWIFIWFILYYYNLLTYNPLFALYCAFFIGYILFIIPMLANSMPFEYIFYFTLITIIIKVIPIYYIHKNNKKIKIQDIQFSLILFLIYLIYITYNDVIFVNYYKNILFVIIEQGKLGNSFTDIYKLI